MSGLTHGVLMVFCIVCFVVALNVLAYLFEPEPEPLKERPNIVIPGQSPRSGLSERDIRKRGIELNRARSRKGSSGSDNATEDLLDLAEEINLSTSSSSSYSHESSSSSDSSDSSCSSSD